MLRSRTLTMTFLCGVSKIRLPLLGCLEVGVPLWASVFPVSNKEGLGEMISKAFSSFHIL